MIKIIEKLKVHDSSEENGKTFRDNLLWSILKLLSSLFTTQKERFSYEELICFYDESNLIDEIYYECLFFIPGKT
jgi:hypothetical protein